MSSGFRDQEVSRIRVGRFGALRGLSGYLAAIVAFLWIGLLIGHAKSR